MRNRRVSLSSILLGVLTVAACAAPGPPPKELVDARLALQDAKSANADKRATRTYDSAAANLDVANKSWEKDHDASAILHQARLAEAEARKAQHAAEAQAAEETIRRENDRKTRNAIALRDAEILMLRKKGQEAELGRVKALAKEQEQALLAAKEKLAAERARAEQEAARLREEQRKLALAAEQQEKLALAAEQARAEAEAIRLREEQEKLAALAAEQARAEQAEHELARLRAEHEKSRAELTSTLSRLAKVREDARGVIVTLPGNIYFNFNKADVKPAMQMQLTKIAKALAAVPNQNLLIEGHTDSIGSNEYNLSLSESRAQSVQKILLDGGIAAERMDIKGYGESKPIADNDTPSGQAQNRRVEIVLVPTKQ
ncbi:MAG: putative Cell envelope biogenesis protein OmpA [Candidatus Nitrospira kreftii]|uniref:Putative Cell envelope biogenesis protein OmpA n=1 Tax=Candidatus Nitrospira kreftii TaxID=2652173 RepID=A0A7S8FG36_9BACT|nr:MAG: putative Cell envelope biogenesis protein OmpA [Candidatus Nitrospira kreftii]